MLLFILGVLVAIPSNTVQSSAQAFPMTLDPSQGVTLNGRAIRPMPKGEYIWTSIDGTTLKSDRNGFPWTAVDRQTEPLYYLRAHFTLSSIPQNGTIYLARSRSASLPQRNVLSIEAVRGRGVVAASSPVSTQQISYGEVLAVKVLAVPFGTESGELLLDAKTGRRSLRSSIGL
jgi:hypothetical protein